MNNRINHVTTINVSNNFNESDSYFEETVGLGRGANVESNGGGYFGVAPVMRERGNTILDMNSKQNFMRFSDSVRAFRSPVVFQR